MAVTILGLISVVSIFATSGYAQSRSEYSVDKSDIIGGAYSTNSTIPIPCDSISLESKRRLADAFILATNSDALVTVNLERDIRVAYVSSDPSVHAVRRLSCPKIKEKAEGWILIGEGFLENSLSKGEQLTLEDKLLLVGLIGHEIAHFVEVAQGLALTRRESEFNADFFAGWYLYNYTSVKNQVREELKLTSYFETLNRLLTVVRSTQQCQTAYTYPLNSRRQSMGRLGYEFGSLDFVSARNTALKFTRIFVDDTPRNLICREVR